MTGRVVHPGDSAGGVTVVNSQQHGMYRQITNSNIKHAPDILKKKICDILYFCRLRKWVVWRKPWVWIWGAAPESRLPTNRTLTVPSSWWGSGTAPVHRTWTTAKILSKDMKTDTTITQRNIQPFCSLFIQINELFNYNQRPRETTPAQRVQIETIHTIQRAKSNQIYIISMTSFFSKKNSNRIFKLRISLQH